MKDLEIEKSALFLLRLMAFTALMVSLVANKTALSSIPGVETTGLIAEEVTFANEQDVLAGTLYSPKEGKPCPAVVLLTGSNRGPRGPLLSRIAQHFAQCGIAVLHYDSAGTGHSTGNTLLQSRDDRAREAISAVRFLRKQRSVNPKQIGLWGGSEGASIALLTAAIYGQEVSFVIPVSGGVGVGGGSSFEQTYYAAERFVHARMLTMDDMQKIVTFEQLTLAFLTGLDILEWDLIETRTKRWPDEPWAEYIKIARMRTRSGGLTAEEKQKVMDSFRHVMGTFVDAKWSKLAPFQKKTLKQVLNLDTDHFFAFLETPRFVRDWDWDLRHKAEKVRCPVLSILGEDDDWVPPNLIATRLRQYLSDANNQDFEVRIIPKANHYITRKGSGLNGEFAPGYIDAMTSWIHAHTTDRVKN
ncbi:MAG: alpha/beta hydrolase family protein [Planctomycetota bacterium]|jgi:pimeloyl-ACP methyl ester carboxylesterase